MPSPDLLLMSFAKIGDFLLLAPYLRDLIHRKPTLRVAVPDLLFPLFAKLEYFPRENSWPNSVCKDFLASNPSTPYVDLTYPLLEKKIDDPQGRGLGKEHFEGPRHVTEAYFQALREHFPNLLPSAYVKPAPYLALDPDPRLLASFGLEPFRYFTIHAGSDHPPKNWDPKNYEEYAQRMVALYPHLKCVSLVGPCDEPLFERSPPPRNFLTLKESFRDAAHVLSGSLFHVDNDSGVHHLAGVLDVPTISIWGPTGPGTWGSLTDRNFIHWGGPSCPDHCGGSRMSFCEDRVCLSSVRAKDLLGSTKQILAAYNLQNYVNSPRLTHRVPAAANTVLRIRESAR